MGTDGERVRRTGRQGIDTHGDRGWSGKDKGWKKGTSGQKKSTKDGKVHEEQLKKAGKMNTLRAVSLSWVLGALFTLSPFNTDLF